MGYSSFAVLNMKEETPSLVDQGVYLNGPISHGAR